MKESTQLEFWKGQLLELQTLDGVMYKTQIVKNEDKHLYIQKPVNRMNRYMTVTNNMPVTFYFHSEERVLYAFESRLHFRHNQLWFTAPHAKNVRKAQRRRFFRVPVEVELNLNIKAIENSEEDKYIMVTTKDISGGGLSFSCSFKVEMEKIIPGILHLETNNNQNTIEFNGKVVNCIRQENDLFKVSLEFIQMKESIRSDIIKYCLFKQVEARNKLKNYSL
ncbi:flagellar brake protein [Paenibacillus fonticola]|uniref:flagellar brake protein n=1 Tax=Paenibacillus fonticola TaxID=379896 RepID=UPI000361F503|nr:PilZ domain-containing protein [Paenibacillus fonticola]